MEMVVQMLKKFKNKFIKWLGGYTVDELNPRQYIIKQDTYNINTITAMSRRVGYCPPSMIESNLIEQLALRIKPYVIFEDYFDFELGEHVTSATIKVCDFNESISNNY